MKKTIKVSGMHCKSCSMLLADVAGEVAGVKSASADFKKGEVVVEIDSEAALAGVRKAIEKEGYKVLG
ncbi:MAG: heavy metal-associated domain-containing protein [Candidatus Micrarchaeia archaeon]|jgi:Cu+-exporting ATPase